MKIKGGEFLGSSIGGYVIYKILDYIQPQLVQSILSLQGVSLLLLIDFIFLGVISFAIFLTVNKKYQWIPKLLILPKYAKAILGFGPLALALIFVALMFANPSLISSQKITPITSQIPSQIPSQTNYTSYPDGVHGNTYLNKTLGIKIERPDDTWQFITDIPKFRETYGIHYGNPVGFLGGVIVGKSFTHESVSVWVLDPVALRFINMTDFINKTLTAMPPVVHGTLNNVHKDISPDGNYGTYTYNSNYDNRVELYYNMVIQMSNGKLYERETLSNMSNVLSQDESMKFIIDHYEIFP